MKIARVINSTPIVLFLVLMAASCFAAPVITNTSGVLNGGTSFTLNGSGFGTKANPRPLRFDNFDGHKHGDAVGVEGYWTKENNAIDNINYNNTNQRRADSVNNIRVNYFYPGQQSGMFYKHNAWGSGYVGKKFISAWVYIDFEKLSASDRWQLKLWRVSTGLGHGDYIGSAYETWWTPSGVADSHYYEHVGTDYHAPGSMYIGMKEGQWVQMQWEYEDSSDVGVADGKVRLTNLFPDSNSRAYTARDNHPLRTTTYPNPTSTPKFGYYITNNLSNGHAVSTYWDDIYIDNTWARVELGNASTYDACTHREMQIPTTWSNNSITFNANQGSFFSGKDAYLFVIDANGIPSPGYKITIGSSGGGSPAPAPAPPSGLKIISN